MAFMMNQEGSSADRPRILYVVNVDWFFLSHRLSLARAALDRGASVTVVAADSGRSEDIRGHGMAFVPLPLIRKSINPLREARAFFFLTRTYRRLAPDLIHHVTVKPILYGSIAARLAGQAAVVNSISGLGFVFSRNRVATALRPLVKILYRVALSHTRSKTVFQNPEDLEDFIRRGLVKREYSALVRGSGVDCRRFLPEPEPEGIPIVMLPSRLIWDKGVGVFAEAARISRARGQKARFVLVGEPDPQYPDSVTPDQINLWVQEGILEWWGQREDMPQVIASASIVTLPATHREGLPKSLLEASAAGRAIIASDVPGCREVVRPQVNGLLVPPGDSEALAKAVELLVKSPERRRELGSAGREIAIREFSEDTIISQTLLLYNQLLTVGLPTNGLGAARY